MPSISDIFEKHQTNAAGLARLQALQDPPIRYVIAITPRSGSSHLCDVMKRTKAFGSPGEVLAAEFIPNILKSVPARDADEYLRHVFRALKSANGVSGIKTSWFQFQNFGAALQNRTIINSFRYVYLTRQDLCAQAVSLYKATESKVFHTNIKHTDDALEKLRSLQYDYQKICDWYDHIVAQQDGWQRFFSSTNITPLQITYEEIEHDVSTVVRGIGEFLGMGHYQGKVSGESIFKKVSDTRNLEWARRFSLERQERLPPM